MNRPSATEDEPVYTRLSYALHNKPNERRIVFTLTIIALALQSNNPQPRRRLFAAVSIVETGCYISVRLSDILSSDISPVAFQHLVSSAGGAKPFPTSYLARCSC